MRKPSRTQQTQPSVEAAPHVGGPAVRCQSLRCALVIALVITITLILGIAAMPQRSGYYYSAAHELAQSAIGGPLFEDAEPAAVAEGDVFYPLSAYGPAPRSLVSSAKAPLLGDGVGLANASAGVERVWPLPALGHRAPFPPHRDDYSMDSEAAGPYVWDGHALAASGAIALPSDTELKAYPKARYPAQGEFGSHSRAPSVDGPPGRAHEGITMRFGVLGLARFVDTRLLPMLNSSLRDARFIDVFIRKTPVSHAVADYIRAQARAFHPYWRGIRVIELFGLRPADKKKRYASERNNAWQNLEILRYWRLEAEAREEVGVAADGSGREAVRFDWNYIIDDDGYVFIDNARAMLWYLDREDRRRTAAAAEAKTKDAAEAWNKAIAAALANSTAAPLTLPTVTPPPVPYYSQENATYTPMLTGQVFGLSGVNFANGGPGYAFNHAALLRLNTSHIVGCLDKYNFWAGDAVAGGCLTSAGVKLIGSYGTYNDRLERCFTEFQCQQWGPFPVAFHKLYGGARAMHIAREVYEQRRARGQLLRWLDLVKAFNRTEFVMPTKAPAPTKSTKKPRKATGGRRKKVE